MLSCWDSVDIGNDIRWAMMSEMDVAEAFCPVDASGTEFFAKYKEMYGYCYLPGIWRSGKVFDEVLQSDKNISGCPRLGHGKASVLKLTCHT